MVMPVFVARLHLRKLYILPLLRCHWCRYGYLIWLQDEKFDQQKGPSISDLVAKETVDKLTYMGWELDQAADPQKVCVRVRVYVCVHVRVRV